MKNYISALLVSILLGACSKQTEDNFSASFRGLDEIRFSYKRAYHDGIFITLRHLKVHGREYILTADIIHGDGMKDDGSPDFTRIEKAITREEFEDFESLFHRESLLKRSYEEPMFGLDGSSWSITGRRAGLELTHRRWCPIARKDAEFVEIGEKFMKFAGIDIPEGEDYY